MNSIALSERDVERFWEKVEVKSQDACWIWKGKLDKKGYGHFQISHENPLGRNNPRSHRVSWFIGFGVIPKEMCVCHKCDNRSCVNPSHLFLGTYDDNNKDRVAKGRSAKGEKASHAILSEKDVLRIKSMKNSGKTQREIAKEFHVSHVAVGNIFNEKTWKHLSNNGGIK